MSKVRLMSYDGWLALPADVRERLGLSTGHQLELVGGAIVLRPTGAAAGMDGGTRTWVRDTMAASPPSGGTMWQTMPPASPRYDTAETVCRSPAGRTTRRSRSSRASGGVRWTSNGSGAFRAASSREVLPGSSSIGRTATRHSHQVLADRAAFQVQGSHYLSVASRAG